MDSTLNLALVGYGQFGKKYFSNIKNNKNFFLKKIFIKKKKKNKKFSELSKRNLLNSNIDAAIICTPVETHFKIAKFFIEQKIPIILEKPAAQNLSQIKKLNNLSKKNLVSVIVNHSDLFNQNINNISSRFKSIGKIKYIDAKFGKYSNKYRDKNLLPCYDWLPHPIAVIIRLFKKVTFNKIIKNEVKMRNKSIFQDLTIELKTQKNINIKIRYSNRYKKKIRNFRFYGDKGFINYDGYDYKNNFIFVKKRINLKKPSKTPLENILSKLHFAVIQKRYFSDLKLALEVEKIQSEIRKKIII